MQKSAYLFSRQILSNDFTRDFIYLLGPIYEFENSNESSFISQLSKLETLTCTEPTVSNSKRCSTSIEDIFNCIELGT